MDPILLEATLRESQASSQHWDHLEREMVAGKAPRSHGAHAWTMVARSQLGSWLVLLGQRIGGATPLPRTDASTDSANAH